MKNRTFSSSQSLAPASPPSRNLAPVRDQRGLRGLDRRERQDRPLPAYAQQALCATTRIVTARALGASTAGASMRDKPRRPQRLRSRPGRSAPWRISSAP